MGSCIVPETLPVGSLVDMRIVGAEGPDLSAVPTTDRRPIGVGATVP